MDLLGNYSEDSETENSPEISSQTPVTENFSVNAKIKEKQENITSIQQQQQQQQSKQEKKKPNVKKRKKLDISFLPENIQAALARGDSVGDSDSDQEEKVVLRSISHEAPTSTNELLSRLPKPKLSSNSSEYGRKLLNKTVSLSVVEDEKITTSSPTEFVQKEDSESDSDVEDMEVISKVSSQQLKPSEVPLMKEPIPSTYIPSIPLLSPPVILPRFEYNPPTTSLLYPTSSEYSQPQVTTASPSLPATTTSHEQKNSKSHHRKRDREIETSLLRGDTSLLDPDSNQLLNDPACFPGGQLIDVQHNHEWDADYYYTQQKRQKELQSIFNFKQNGGDKMIAQPTKLQHKRHQINSLVMSAADSELELLEAKGRQMKTKYETQSKYGW